MNHLSTWRAYCVCRLSHASFMTCSLGSTVHRQLTIWMLVAGLISTVGCGPGPLDERWAPPRPLGERTAAHRAPREPIEPEEGSTWKEPTGQITLREVLAAALLKNPELASDSWAVRIGEARILQAGLRPNPEIALQVENVAGTGATRGVESAETTVMLSQLVELGGKRMKRVRLAELDRDLSAWGYEARRVSVLTETTQRFIEVAAVQRQFDLAREGVMLAEEALAAADKRVAAGTAIPLEKTRASVPAATARMELRGVERDLSISRRRLASMWGASEVRFDAVVAEFDRVDEAPTLRELVDHISNNPDVARWSVEIAQRRSGIELARAQAIPDVTAGLGARRISESDDTAAVFELSLPLPLFDRNQGGVLEARLAGVKAEHDRRAAELRVSTALGEAYDELTTAREGTLMLKQDILPAAQSSYDAINAAYERGQVGYLEVIDARRSLIDAQHRYIDALATYHRAVAETEGLIGQSLSTVGRHKTSQPATKDNP